MTDPNLKPRLLVLNLAHTSPLPLLLTPLHAGGSWTSTCTNNTFSTSGYMTAVCQFQKEVGNAPASLLLTGCLCVWMSVWLGHTVSHQSVTLSSSPPTLARCPPPRSCQVKEVLPTPVAAAATYLSVESVADIALFCRFSQMVYKGYIKVYKNSMTAYEAIMAKNPGLSYLDYNRLAWRFSHKNYNVGGKPDASDAPVTYYEKSVISDDPDSIGGLSLWLFYPPGDPHCLHASPMPQRLLAHAYMYELFTHCSGIGIVSQTS